MAEEPGMSAWVNAILKANPQIRINVGGVHYVTRASTLLEYAPGYVKKMYKLRKKKAANEHYQHVHSPISPTHYRQHNNQHKRTVRSEISQANSMSRTHSCPASPVDRPLRTLSPVSDRSSKSEAVDEEMNLNVLGLLLIRQAQKSFGEQSKLVAHLSKLGATEGEQSNSDSNKSMTGAGPVVEGLERKRPDRAKTKLAQNKMKKPVVMQLEQVRRCSEGDGHGTSSDTTDTEVEYEEDNGLKQQQQQQQQQDHDHADDADADGAESPLLDRRVSLHGSDSIELFIDRDGTHFRYILNFLREGTVLLPPDPVLRHEVLVEARFYMLHELVRVIESAPLRPQCPFSGSATASSPVCCGVTDIEDVLKASDRSGDVKNNNKSSAHSNNSNNNSSNSKNKGHNGTLPATAQCPVVAAAIQKLSPKAKTPDLERKEATETPKTKSKTHEKPKKVKKAKKTSKKKQKQKQKQIPPVVLDPNPSKNVFSWEEIRLHHTSESCWLVVKNRVYDVTEFLQKHPAGADSILRHGGQDSTKDFYFHSSNAQKHWKPYEIGRVKGSSNLKCTIQ